MDTKFHAEMKPQPMTAEPNVIIWPTAMGAKMLVNWSILRIVAFISTERGGEGREVCESERLPTYIIQLINQEY